MQTERERGEFRSFIGQCCRLVHLEFPEDEYLVERLVFATNGSLGRAIECTHSAIGRALQRKDGHLTLEDFQRGFALKTGLTGDGPFDPEPWPVLKDILDKKGWSV